MYSCNILKYRLSSVGGIIEEFSVSKIRLRVRLRSRWPLGRCFGAMLGFRMEVRRLSKSLRGVSCLARGNMGFLLLLGLKIRSMGDFMIFLWRKFFEEEVESYFLYF